MPSALYNQLSAMRPAQAMVKWAGPARLNGDAAVKLFYDGDFDQARPICVALPEYPFRHEGDGQTVILRQRFCQKMSAYQPQPYGGGISYVAVGGGAAAGFTPARAYVGAATYCIGESNFTDVGAGIGQWERAVATLPPRRNVLESFSYPLQYVIEGALREIAITVGSRVQHDYFLLADHVAYPPLQRLALVQPAGAGGVLRRGEGDLHLGGSLGNLVLSTDAEVVAEDSTYGLWHYPIYFRRTRYVPGPKVETWGIAFNP